MDNPKIGPKMSNDPSLQKNATWPFADLKFGWNYRNEFVHVVKSISLSLPFLTLISLSLLPFLTHKITLLSLILALTHWVGRVGATRVDLLCRRRRRSQICSCGLNWSEKKKKKPERRKKKREGESKLEKKRKRKKLYQEQYWNITWSWYHQRVIWHFFQKLAHLPFWEFKIGFLCNYCNSHTKIFTTILFSCY